MLESLHIENIAVIKNADIEFSKGFTVLTGETGAGKSIIIDSINLLLGARPSKELIRSGEESAAVSAVFAGIDEALTERLAECGAETDDDGKLVIMRRITADGKASTRLNGRVISVTAQKEIGKLLINIHGQHDNQSLLQPEKHIGYLDAYAGCGEALTEYERIYDEMQVLTKRISELTHDEQEKLRMTDLLKYQIADIDSARLRNPDEEDKLLAKKLKIQNIEKILKYTKTVYRSLYRNEKGTSASDQLQKAADALEQLSDILPEANDYIERLNGFCYELEDIAETVRGLGAEDIEDPTAELNRIESRLDMISKLERKYGTTVAEILEFRKKAVSQLEDIEMSDEKLAQCRTEFEKCRERAVRSAAELTKQRRAAASELERRIMEELAFLEMGKVRFSVQFRRASGLGGEVKFSRRGTDEVEFMISTNPGEPLKPLSKIASGGELSRIMLALKSVFAGRDSTSTLIFDEVDTGVSGKTSQKIGVKLHSTAESCQVLCVTHSAQIAALADSHLFISKSVINGRTETKVQPLPYEERVKEIARIMGGEVISEKLLATAEEMINNKK